MRNQISQVPLKKNEPSLEEFLAGSDNTEKSGGPSHQSQQSSEDLYPRLSQDSKDNNVADFLS